MNVRLRYVYPLLLTAFLVAMGLHGQLRVEHLLVFAIICGCYVRWTQQFIDLFIPLGLAGLLYDVQRLWIFEMPVHVSGPYLLEKGLFGGGMTPNEFFLEHHAAWADILTAIPYLTYIVEALVMCAVLFLKDRELCRRYAWVFFWVNIAGMLTEALFPVAPPWYVQKYGLGPAIRGISSDPAATLRFDQLTGTHIFASFYGRGTDVFGAIPSLHAAYPVLVYLYARELKNALWTRVALGYAMLMGVAAVYLQHHYVIDVIIGVAYAAAGFAVERTLARRGVPQSLVATSPS